MARRFLPALRGLESKSLQPVTAPAMAKTEKKDLLVGSYYTSTQVMGGLTYGLEDRAAGYDLTTVIVEGYERSVWVYKCVEWISGHQSRLPFRIGRHLDSDERELLLDHPLYRVMNGRANPLETGRQFRKRLSAQVLLNKRGAFVEVTKSRAGTITRLDLLPPDRVRPVPDPRGDYLSHYEFWTRYGGMREIAPERIRWIREPHPTDPFCGITPLDAAGISVELDYLSRIYNVSFIKNDGRPGGIVGVDTDTLDDQELERIERRFAPGATEAGKITVIGTGTGGIDYVDTTTKPRDMAYGDTATNAKVEILSAFGLAESLFGQSGGRTFDNAENDGYNAWAQTQVPHNDLIASAFLDDVADGDEGWVPFIDTSTVDELELPRRKKREEARQEFQNGLRSVNEYRPLADLRPVDSPYARALWLTPAKAPVPERPEDAAALGVGAATPGAPGTPGVTTPDAAPDAGGDAGGATPPAGPTDTTPTPDAGAAPAGPAPQTGQDAVAAARQPAPAAAPAPTPTAAPAPAAPPAPAEQAAPAAQPAAAQAVSAARSSLTPDSDNTAAADAVSAARTPVQQADDEDIDTGAAADVVAAARKGGKLEGKALSADDDDSNADPDEVSYEQDPNDQARVETATAAALDSLLARQVGVIQARLESPKARKGTKFWTADGPQDDRGGDQPVDTGRIVDSDRWVNETTSTLSPIVTAAAADSGHKLLEAFLAGGVISAAVDGLGSLPLIAGQATVKVALGALSIAADAMGAWLADVEQLIAANAENADTIDAVTGPLHDYYVNKSAQFAKSLAVSIASATVQGAADAAAHTLTPLPVTGADQVTSLPTDQAIHRGWITMQDERVRPTHAAANGQVQELGHPFHVGAAELMYPGDPAGPPAEIRWCRCHLRYSADRNSSFLLPPATPQES